MIVDAANRFVNSEKNQRESETVVRIEFDPRSETSWSELIRSAVAMVNSGGGVLEIHPTKAASVLAPSSSADSSPNLRPVRIVTDPDAPALQPQHVERLYPWRQKDLVGELNRRLGRRALNSYDIQAVRRQHHLDKRPEFVFNLPGAGRRYSPAAAEWIMDQTGRDPEFFRHARTADQEMLRLLRKKPR
jgi:hypothetical protein